MQTRILKSLGIAAVIAATAAPSALARPVDESGSVTPLAGISVKAPPPAVDKAALGNGSIPYLSHGIGVEPAQFGGTGVVHVVQTKVVRPDVRAGFPRSLPSMVVSTTGTRFGWGDAAIGASAALGLLLVMTFGAMTALRNRKNPLAA